MLKTLRDQSSLPWLCVGDFNEIVQDNEKLGGVLRLVKQMEDFQDVIHACGLMELPYSGPRFTWIRKRHSEIIAERLDMGLATKGWMDKFPFSKEDYIAVVSSDHLLLLFSINSQQRRRWNNTRRFRFENMWT